MRSDPHLTSGEIARRTLVATLVVVGVVVGALALWKIRLVVSLLYTETAR